MKVLLFNLTTFMVSILLSVSASQLQAQEALPIKTIRPYNLALNVEMGFLANLENQIQFGKNGTYFSLPYEAGQNILYPVMRFSVDFKTGRNLITFLYQPLRLESSELIRRDFMIDDLIFPSGTPVKFLYDFPFYRLSYLYEFTGNQDDWDFAFGASLQIRNTTITTESLDGNLFRQNQNIGAVPVLKFLAGWHPGNLFWTELEADGFYAPIKYLNGDKNDVVGAILDASIRAGVRLDGPVETFINLRYLSGGAEGSSEKSIGPGDGFVRNWLHFMTLSLGARVRL